jgi:ABC-type antimicrobial peptide transport system permease subunit
MDAPLNRDQGLHKEYSVVGSYGIGYVFRWSVLVSWSAILPAFLFAAAVGVFFGYYPARKASRLKPIEALRYE